MISSCLSYLLVYHLIWKIQFSLYLKINDYCQFYYLQTNAALLQYFRAWFSNSLDTQYLGLIDAFCGHQSPKISNVVFFLLIAANTCVTLPSHALLIDQIMLLWVRDTRNMLDPGKDPWVAKATSFMLKWDGMLVPKFIRIVVKGGGLSSWSTYKYCTNWQKRQKKWRRMIKIRMPREEQATCMKVKQLMSCCKWQQCDVDIFCFVVIIIEIFSFLSN